MSECYCGSGEPKWPIYDGYGIFLSYTCSVCEEEKMKRFRPDIMEHYDCDEEIDEE